MLSSLVRQSYTVIADYAIISQPSYFRHIVNLSFLTPEPNGVGEGVYGIGRVLRRRRRRRRDGFSVGTP